MPESLHHAGIRRVFNVLCPKSADPKFSTAWKARISVVHVSDVCSLSREASRREPTRASRDSSWTCQRHYSRRMAKHRDKTLVPNQSQQRRRRRKKKSCCITSKVCTQIYATSRSSSSSAKWHGNTTPVIVNILVMSQQFKKKKERTCLGSCQDTGGVSSNFTRVYRYIRRRQHYYMLPFPPSNTLSCLAVI